MGEQGEILLAHVAEQCSSNTERIEKLEENQQAVTELAISVRTMATEQSHMQTDLAEVKTDVKTLAGKAGKRWDAIVDKVILLVVAAVVGFFLGHVGL